MRVRLWTVCAFAAAAAIVVLLAFRPSVTAQDKPKIAEPAPGARVKWEYKAAAQDKLTELGDEGWELVVVTGGQPYIESSRANVQGAGPNAPTVTQNTIKYSPILYHMKRQK